MIVPLKILNYSVHHAGHIVMLQIVLISFITFSGSFHSEGSGSQGYQ